MFIEPMLPKEDKLLTREDFKHYVFTRDRQSCVVCFKPAIDAHHILERRLFKDGGYYLGNGVSVCTDCHIEAERTNISCEELRQKANITKVILPEHLYKDEVYDKWGNLILPNKTRMKGELFYEEPVQRILEPYLSNFTHIVKFPRTFHLPWSPNLQNDDKMLESLDGFIGEEIVITEKMDGENTSMYSDYIHARALEYSPREDRNWIRALHGRIKYDIPEGWRVCGENLYAEHSIHYDSLPSYFLMFSIWNNRNVCLSWDETKTWAELLGLTMVKELYRGPFNRLFIQTLYGERVDQDKVEGHVIRVTREFPYRDYKKVVGKYVRKGHITTDEHWTKKAIVKNGLSNME